MTKNALITGITGQDGAYLARLLLDKGYRITDTKLLLTAEVDVVRGHAAKALETLGRAPKTTLDQLIGMVEVDLSSCPP